MNLNKFVPVSALFLTLICGYSSTMAAEKPAENDIKIDVPVVLKQAKVVFNMDHIAAQGDMPVGLRYMDLMTKRFKENKTEGNIIAVFHGMAGYMILNDEAYNQNRKVKIQRLPKLPTNQMKHQRKSMPIRSQFIR